MGLCKITKTTEGSGTFPIKIGYYESYSGHLGRSERLKEVMTEKMTERETKRHHRRGCRRNFTFTPKGGLKERKTKLQKLLRAALDQERKRENLLMMTEFPHMPWKKKRETKSSQPALTCSHT